MTICWATAQTQTSTWPKCYNNTVRKGGEVLQVLVLLVDASRNFFRAAKNNNFMTISSHRRRHGGPKRTTPEYHHLHCRPWLRSCSPQFLFRRRQNTSGCRSARAHLEFLPTAKNCDILNGRYLFAAAATRIETGFRYCNCECLLVRSKQTIKLKSGFILALCMEICCCAQRSKQTRPSIRAQMRQPKHNCGNKT